MATVLDGERAWTWGSPQGGTGNGQAEGGDGRGSGGLVGRVLGLAQGMGAAEQQGRHSPEPHTSAREAHPRPTPRLTKTCHSSGPCLSLPPQGPGRRGNCMLEPDGGKAGYCHIGGGVAQDL